MAELSQIGWTDSTFNPVIGCAKVAPECKHCYAESDFDTRRHVVKWGTLAAGGTRKLTSADTWRKPHVWNKKHHSQKTRHRVFCASLSDIFEDWSGTLFAEHGNIVLSCHACGVTWRDGDEQCPQCRRSTNVRPSTLGDIRRTLFTQVIDKAKNLDWQILTKRPQNVVRMLQEVDELTGPVRRSNVWIGTSAGCQASYDKFTPHMDAIPRSMCRVKFLSCEPMLGPVNLGSNPPYNWVICGGESKPDCRPMEIEWALDLAAQCARLKIPFFMKQLGGHPDKRTDIETFPAELQIRSFPR